MSYIVALTLTLFLAAATQPQLALSELGIPVNLALLARQSVPGECTPGSGKTSICSNCTAISVCIGGSASDAVSCGKNNQYCNPGDLEASCSTTAAQGCEGSSGGQAGRIACPSSGMFPDPRSCSYYHICRDGQSQSDLYECPGTTTFNLNSRACINQNAAYCITIKCGTSSGFVYYGSSRQYYAFCSVINGATNSFIFKCPDRATFNMDTMACAYSCPGQGNFANSNDAASFYQCYIANGRWVADLKACPTGTKFNQTLSYCN